MNLGASYLHVTYMGGCVNVGGHVFVCSQIKKGKKGSCSQASVSVSQGVLVCTSNI